MSRADRGLATDLVYTTLRRRGTLDAVLATVVTRPLTEVDPRVLDLLRMATCEHMYLDKPAHAVVDSAVTLAASVGAASARGIRQRGDAQASRSSPVSSCSPHATEGLAGDALLAVRHSHPDWIIRAFRDVLGPGELEALLERDNRPPRVTLAARPGRISRDAAARRADPVVAVGHLPGPDRSRAACPRSGRPGRGAGSGKPVDGPGLLPGGGGGRRTMPGWTCVPGPAARPRCWPICCPTRGRLVAVEQHEHRADLVRAALRGTPGVVQVVVADAAQVEGSFSRVLLDAPCAGLGVVAPTPGGALAPHRPPTSRSWRDLQRRLLGHAVDVVPSRRGGRLRDVFAALGGD